MQALCRWGPRCAVPACVRPACWLRGCWKKPAGRRSACPAPFSAQQNACGCPARRACHHGRHCAAQPARGHSYAVHQCGKQRPGPIACAGHCPAQYPGGHCGCRAGILRYAQPCQKPCACTGFGPGRASGRPGGILLAARPFSPLFLNGLLALVAGVMLQVSFAQLLAAGFSFGKNSACAAGLAVGTLCMGVGLYLV